MEDVLTFEEALKASEPVKGSRHLLLGNGFSIAYDPSVFTYRRLLDEADFSALSIDARALFTAFGTSDFERVIEVLRSAALLLEMYPSGDQAVAAEIAADAVRLKEALAEVLSRKHPDHVGVVDVAELLSARRFLAHFDRIYTVNYDLLLYWATMQDGDDLAVVKDDGFGESDEEPGAEWVSWQSMITYNKQRVFYLHGGLHLYDAGTELRKITWNRTGTPLVDQIRAALAANFYPLVVTEGTTKEKFHKILHHAYLNHALRSFSQIGGSLFIYGHSLAANDEHILRLIEDGPSAALFVGLHDPGSEAADAIVRRAEAMSVARGTKKPLKVWFFDSSTARVWRA